MSAIQEAPSFAQKVKEFIAPQEAAVPYKVLTTIAKAGELALVLAGTGMLGIGVVTGIYEFGIEGLRAFVTGAGMAGINIAVDSSVRTVEQVKNLKRE